MPRRQEGNSTATERRSASCRQGKVETWRRCTTLYGEASQDRPIDGKSRRYGLQRQPPSSRGAPKSSRGDTAGSRSCLMGQLVLRHVFTRWPATHLLRFLYSCGQGRRHRESSAASALGSDCGADVRPLPRQRYLVEAGPFMLDALPAVSCLSPGLAPFIHWRNTPGLAASETAGPAES